MSAAQREERVSPWRHVRAVVLLPFMNTVVIPSALVLLFPADHSPWTATAVGAAALGAMLATAGAALVAHCIVLFVRLGRGTLAPWDPTHELVDAGAYGHIRNPMKAGLFLVLAGEALVTQSPALLAWFTCFAIVNVVYIRLHEEPGLAKRFGSRYRAYCENVPPWWPDLHRLARMEVK